MEWIIAYYIIGVLVAFKFSILKKQEYEDQRLVELSYGVVAVCTVLLWIFWPFLLLSIIIKKVIEWWG